MSIDAKIDELFKVVRRQKSEVEAAEKESKQSWKTNCTIHFDWSSTPFNIQTANETTLKKIVMELLKIIDYSDKADKELGLETSATYDGFAFQDWLTDCKKRMSIIGLRAKKDNLAQLEKRLDAIVSPEQRRQMELDAITASLDNLP